MNGGSASTPPFIAVIRGRQSRAVEPDGREHPLLAVKSRRWAVVLVWSGCARRCGWVAPSFAYSSSARNAPVRFEVWCKRNLVTDSSCNGGGRTQRSDGRRRDRQVTRPSFAPGLGVCEHDAAPRALVEIGGTERPQVIPRDDSPVASRATHAAAMDGKTLAHGAGYLYSIIAGWDSPPPEALLDGAAGCEVSAQRMSVCRREDSTCDRASPSPSRC